MRTFVRRMRVLNMPPPTAMKLQMLFAVSFAWAFHEIPKYQHQDPLTSEILLCDQCPPGTAVERHCTAMEPTVCVPCPEKRFAEQWHWGDSCQHCTSVCKERQIVRRECNSTHNRVCECKPGYHLVVEFCVRHTACRPGFGVAMQGTPDRDAVCERCPSGYFSSTSSSTEPCVPHRDCSQLGLKTFRSGTATQDTLCETDSEDFDCSHQHIECNTDITLCEEAIFQFVASPPLASISVERLSESLPGRKVDWKNVERLKKSCSPQQQTLHLLRLWREQNKDQDKLNSIIQGVNNCERKVSRCASVKNLTLEDLLMLMDSLTGEKVSEEDVRAVVRSCPSQRYILQLLHLWKVQNRDQDLAKALAQSLRKLRSKGARRPLFKTLKRMSRIISASSMHRMYEKMIVSMIQDGTCFKTKTFND
ncbi:tumor necrosis factor receptor superfamily member 11B-like [Triplophysa dalaica]|uniref:tumor necrosis factor receptor superfamily member 11B-like n=1 Tax=Triplophysa dalaica TaxID=1582913 RepID=UPI0024E001B2|nr:tumor necrosis factor receptor superfamily member 11B-like [Triplophysa dalaica]